LVPSVSREEVLEWRELCREGVEKVAEGRGKNTGPANRSDMEKEFECDESSVHTHTHTHTHAGFS